MGDTQKYINPKSYGSVKRGLKFIESFFYVEEIGLFKNRIGMLMNKLLKPILAGVAIILTIPAIYLPFRLQNIYHRVTALITYKLKDTKIIAHLIMEKEKK